MTDERYHELSTNRDAKLNAAEINAGWHWCLDWDLLLVGPGMVDELKSCHCEEGKRAKALTF